MNVHSRVKRIRHHLSIAWLAFFSRYGKLTPTQIAAIPEVLQEKNVVVSAPTASGKTESVVAPVAQLHREQNWTGLAVLYLVPTRALGNDMFKRLHGALEQMHIRVAIKHGDTPRLPAQGADWLITTPESLDSLLSRVPHLLMTIRVVIVDEIHLLDSTYRGDQLRVLLNRLRANNEHQIKVHLLSATLADPQAIARRYVQSAEIVAVGGQRHIKASYCANIGEAVAFIKQSKWRKVLFFCNKRFVVEEVAGELRSLWRPYTVVTHHGKLDKNQRESAEQAMKETAVALCVATSTLEIGIDIGNIDAVVLVDPPWSLSSLKQRIGRANRRQGIINVIAVCGTIEERDFFQEMFAAAKAGFLEQELYEADCSVLIQQTMSLLYSRRAGVTTTELDALLMPLSNGTIVPAVLDALKARDFALTRYGKWFPTDKLIDVGDVGSIHSNIPDQTEYEVQDVRSGRNVGQIRGAVDNVFLLGGVGWRIVGFERDKLMVKRHEGKANSAEFGRSHNVGKYHYWLPPELRKPA